MLYLSGIIIATFLAVVLISKKHKTQADYILFVWLLVLGCNLLAFYVLFTGQQLRYPAIAALGFPLPLAHGPFLFLYTCRQTSDQPFNKRQLLHFLPLFLSYLSFAAFFVLPFDQQAEVFRQQGKGFEIQSKINVYAIYISGIVYITLSLIRLFRYRRTVVNKFSNTEKINFNWLLYLIIWLVIIWIIVLFVQKDELIYAAASLFVLWLGYFGIKQVQVFSQNAPKQQSIANRETSAAPGAVSIVQETMDNIKYQKSALSEEEAMQIHERLKILMAEQMPYRNPELTLDELARSLEVHPNTLSQVINSREQKTFYDLINEKRVEAFIRSLSDLSNRQYTLLAMAYDCGFNSKASFNRNFKKYTGLTPSEYTKQHQLQ